MKNLLTFIIAIISLSLNAQSDSLKIELYKLAMEDGKITRKERKLIKELTASPSFSLGNMRDPDNYRKDLDPAYYIQNGATQGYKMILFRLQSRIIEDMDKAGRRMIDGKVRF